MSLCMSFCNSASIQVTPNEAGTRCLSAGDVWGQREGWHVWRASGVELAMFDVVSNSTAPGTIANFNAACWQESEAISAQCSHMTTATAATTTTKAFAFLNKIAQQNLVWEVFGPRVPEMKGHFVNEVCGLFRINAVKGAAEWERNSKREREREREKKTEMRNFNMHMFGAETNMKDHKRGWQ